MVKTAPTSRLKNSISEPAVAAFRLARHHLAGETQADLLIVCRDVCGIQAQVMSSAQTALWARMHHLTLAEIHAALWKSRTLVKTYGMRGTLHLLPAADFSVYSTALRTACVRPMRRVMSRLGVTREQADRLNELVVAALNSGPLSGRELTANIEPKVAKPVRSWMEKVWNVFRPALAEGLICYGPGRGNENTYVRVDQWLPKSRTVSEAEAQQTLLRRFLRAYGPATPQDFSKWTGLSMPEAKAVFEQLKEDLAEVTVENRKSLILRQDFEQLQGAALEEENLRLLPGFDPYMLAHVDKNHLVISRHYKRVYRNQGWISPVVLLNGTVIGTWSYTRRGKIGLLEIQPFVNFSRRIRKKIEKEAASLGRFFETSWEIKFRT